MSMNSGLSAWKSSNNHNPMILQQNSQATAKGDVQISYFGGSAFRIKTPSGLTVMLDPWRNLPTGDADWFFHDFPLTLVDIGISTHAHFDHDALHRLDAHMLIDRPIGAFEFGDLKIKGIADKHATDATYAPYDFHKINAYFKGKTILPPNNARSWDNCLVVIETGNLRILHWGDNRHNPPESVWEQIGDIDILLVPVDDSEHVMGYLMVEEIITRLAPNIVIPHHYFIWNVVLRQSTLFAADNWLERQPDVVKLSKASQKYRLETLPTETTVHSFGDHVAFDVDAWHEANGKPCQRTTD